MIQFEAYVGEYIILITNPVCTPEEIFGIRSETDKIFKFKGQYVLVRAINQEDLRDDDFVLWLDSMWGHNEINLKKFIRYRREQKPKKKKATAKRLFS